jgi:hypothetical protein
MFATIPRRAWLLAILAILVVTLSCTSERPASERSESLHDLEDVSQLRAAFNRDIGHPRLVVLLSPT